jgi:hypothetical protein
MYPIDSTYYDKQTDLRRNAYNGYVIMVFKRQS